jgi:hypothetical protein
MKQQWQLVTEDEDIEESEENRLEIGFMGEPRETRSDCRGISSNLQDGATARRMMALLYLYFQAVTELPTVHNIQT